MGRPEVAPARRAGVGRGAGAGRPARRPRAGHAAGGGGRRVVRPGLFKVRGRGVAARQIEERQYRRNARIEVEQLAQPRRDDGVSPSDTRSATRPSAGATADESPTWIAYRLSATPFVARFRRRAATAAGAHSQQWANATPARDKSGIAR